MFHFKNTGSECPWQSQRCQRFMPAFQKNVLKKREEKNPERFYFLRRFANVVFGGPRMLINLNKQTKTLTSIKYC